MLRSVGILWAGACSALVLSTTALLAYLVMQQVERTGANDPQVQLAEDAAAFLSRGGSALEVVPPRSVDIGRSLAPVVIVLDDAGHPIASSGTLDGVVPVPPSGVLAEVRARGEERVTWAPRRSVRLASVVERVDGPRPGFVIAARSLREVEGRIALIGRLVLFIWLAGMTVLATAVATAAVVQRRSSPGSSH